MSLIRQTAGIWGPVGFVGSATMAARHQPGYSHISHHVSGLAARGERSARVMVPGFLALGISSLLMPVPDDDLARLAKIAGTTTIVAGLIQVSEPRCPQPGSDPAATASDVGHGIASVATFVLWTAMPFVARRQSEPIWYRRMNCGLLGAACAGLVAAGCTTRAESSRRRLAQRVFLGTMFAWHIATTFVTTSRSPHGAVSGPRPS